MTCSPDTCGSIGSLLKIAVKDSDLVDPCLPATFDAGSERYEILREDVKYTDSTLGGRGLTGRIDPIFAHLRSGTRIVHGSILMEVGPDALDAWIPRILGKSGSSPYTTDETFDLLPFDILMARDKGTVIYRHCAVNSALLRARASIDGEEQVMQLMLNIFGYEEHGYTDPPTNSVLAAWPGTPPPLPVDEQTYWVLGDGTLKLDIDGDDILQDDEEYYFDAFNLFLNNNLFPQTRNFTRITCLQSRGREYRLRMPSPYTADSHLNMYLNRFEGKGQLSFLGTKNFVAGDTEYAYETTFDFPKLWQTRKTPATSGPGEIPLPLDFRAFATGSTEPIVITNTAM